MERVTFAAQDTGFAVLRVKPSRGALFTATGHVPQLSNGAGLVGAEFCFKGKWTLTKYGRQFAFTQCHLVGSELHFFLSKVVKGLGAKMASLLISRYGEEGLVRILDESPEELLAVKGIKEKRLALIKRSWRKHRSLKELSEYLGGQGGRITPNLLIRIYNHFEEGAVEAISDNPYCLTQVRGIGFKTADLVARGLGIPPDSPHRIRAGVSHVLVDAAETNGHCFLKREELLGQVKELLSGGEGERDLEDEEILLALEPMKAMGELEEDGEGRIGLSSYRYMEEWLAEFFAQRSHEQPARRVIPSSEVESFMAEFQQDSGLELAPEQEEIIRMIAQEPRMVFALAGYAGTGKTTVCRAILDMLTRYYVHEDRIVCCAFTGMASSRLRKATGYEAFTIHSLLKYKGEGEFEHGPDRPLPYDVVLLDEASMVNLSLFYRLAKALKPTTLFVMVGDPAQLPPIGAGNVFSDAIDQEMVPAVHLNRIFRQGPESVLTVFANDIRQGIVPEGVGKKGWKDFEYVQVEPRNIYALKHKSSERELKEYREENNEAIKKRILELAARYRKELDHPIWEFQVLTPMRVGMLGCEVLNQELQSVLNPGDGVASVCRGGITLKEGDKVVHLQNRDMEVMHWADFQDKGREFDPSESRRVFNGNVGLVIGIDKEAEQFYVVYPERIVVGYYFDHLGDIIELAYALTVHKAQGSQYPVVAIPLTNSHFIMLNNKWFYTAITRAESKVYLVGQPYALKRACVNSQSVERKTWLSLAAGKEEG